MAAIPFDEFVKTISRLGGVAAIDDGARARIDAAADALSDLLAVSRSTLRDLVAEHPDWVPVLALCVGVTQEQLKNTLKFTFGTSSWERLARQQPDDLIQLLDDEFELVEEIDRQRTKEWSFADMLAERYASRVRAAGSIRRGRSVEDQVQRLVDDLGLPRQMRTSFRGRGGRVAPCDLAIPEGGESALIVCGIKGFDSTGSKLTDATREIEAMADVRLPTQYVFALVDGMGWMSRQADLRRIHGLWERRSIDGLYTLSRLDEFRADLEQAARRVGLVG